MSESAKSNRNTNIFKLVAEVKNFIVEDRKQNGEFSPYGNSVYIKIFDSIETYFNSRVWANNKKEEAFFPYATSDLTSGQIAKLLDMNPNTYRSMVSRISDRIKNIIFEGKDFKAFILGTSSENISEIERMKNYIDFLNSSFNIYEEFDSSQLNIINDYVIQPDDKPISDDDYFQVLLFLASFNSDVFKARLHYLNPMALGKVLNELGESTMNDSINYFNLIKRDGMARRNLTEKWIERCKASLKQSKEA